MATAVKIERSVADEEPNGCGPVRVLWNRDGYLELLQDSDRVVLSREHAGDVAAAVVAALTDPR
ncbi:hypothetical protein [Sphingomonas sp.]|uniref:hypothetical protein n=1 Tax=Sphingomonas sp. TaxID=28214 RepID=UPI003CC5D7BD